MSDLPFRRAGYARTWRHLLLGLLMVLPLLAGAQSYMGKVCMIVTVTTRDQGPVTPERFAVEFEVSNLGGSTYSAAGSFPSSTGEPMVATGIATVVGGDIFFNMVITEAHADGWRDTGINRARLSLATMTGTFYEIGHDYNTVSRTYDQTRYTAGTAELSLSACQR